MNKHGLLVISMAALLLTLAACSEEPLNKENMLSTLDSLDQKFTVLDNKIELERWRQYKYGESDSLEFFENLYGDIVFDAGAFRYMQNGANLLDNELDQRRRDIMFGTLLAGRIEFDGEIAPLRQSLSRSAQRFRANLDAEPKTAEALCRIYNSDRDRSRRELAYRAWCSAGEEYGGDLEKLFRLRNQKTQRLGYNNFLALYFNSANINLDEHLKLVRYLDSLSAPRYGEILDGIRESMGGSEVEIWDIGFAFAALRQQIDRYFPVDSQLTFIGRSLEDIGFDLDKLPIYLDEGVIGSEEKSVRAFFVAPPFDQRLPGHVLAGYDAASALNGELGKAIHFANITQDHPLFVRRVDDIALMATGRFFAGLLADPQWLSGYAALPARLVQDFTESEKKLAVIDLRAALLSAEFEIQAYANPNRDLNRVYWDLFEKYMMLPRHEDLRPWAAVKCYIDRPAGVQYALYADLISAQTQAFILQNYGGVIGNQMTSSFLIQNYFRFGGRYDWLELVKRGTDEELNPKYLLLRLGL